MYLVDCNVFKKTYAFTCKNYNLWVDDSIYVRAYTVSSNQMLMCNNYSNRDFLKIYLPALYAIALEAGTDFL